MIEWFGSLTTEQQMYTGLALVASATVLFQLAAMMVGVGAEELMAAGDYDLDGAEDHPSGLGLISGRTVSAFFVGFGWAGFLLTNEGRTGFAPAALATLVGFGFAWSLVRLMRFLHGLRHSGSLDYRNALGETGTVYLEIHPALATGGTGRGDGAGAVAHRSGSHSRPGSHRPRYAGRSRRPHGPDHTHRGARRRRREGEQRMEYLILAASLVVVLFGTLFAMARRYRRCPSDKVLVVYGKIGGGGHSAKCLHGGAAFIWPLIQDYQYLDLTPIPIEIKLEGALSQQNIRVNTPATFTVGISTEPGVMENAAERMLGLSLGQIQELARDIIFGQMRVVIATMPIEEINADRDKLIENIFSGVEVELKKVGLRLINVNIQDITDESGYIDALGKEAAARAINDAKIKVAEQTKDGEIGRAVAERDQRVNVASAGAVAVRGENEAKVTVARSNADRREAEAEAERRAGAAENVKTAEALRESYGAEQEAEKARAAAGRGNPARQRRGSGRDRAQAHRDAGRGGGRAHPPGEEGRGRRRANAARGRGRGPDGHPSRRRPRASASWSLRRAARPNRRACSW